MKKLKIKLTPFGWSLILILCLLSINAMASDMICETKKNYDLCQNEIKSCFITRVWGQESFCVDKK
jgi:hypothetical protein